MSRIFGDVRQDGYVVEDIEAAMQHWTEVLGVGPFFYFEEVPVANFQYRRELSEVSGPKGAFFRYIREVAQSWDGSEPIRRMG